MGVLYAALSELAAKVQQEEIALQLEKVGEPPTSCGIDTLISRALLQLSKPGINAEGLGRMLGDLMVQAACKKGDGKLLKCCASGFPGVVAALNKLHLHVPMAGQPVPFPADIRVQKVTPTSLELHCYSSAPGNSAWVEGAVQAIGKRAFGGLPVQVDLLRGRADGSCDHEVWRVKYPEQPRASLPLAGGARDVAAAQPLLAMPAEVLYDAHPFHFVVDQQCRLLQVGSGLGRLKPGAAVGQDMRQVFQVLFPTTQTTYEGVAAVVGQPAVISAQRQGQGRLELRGHFLRARVHLPPDHPATAWHDGASHAKRPSDPTSTCSSSNTLAPANGGGPWNSGLTVRTSITAATLQGPGSAPSPSPRSDRPGGGGSGSLMADRQQLRTRGNDTSTPSTPASSHHLPSATHSASRHHALAAGGSAQSSNGGPFSCVTAPSTPQAGAGAGGSSRLLPSITGSSHHPLSPYLAYPFGHAGGGGSASGAAGQSRSKFSHTVRGRWSHSGTGTTTPKGTGRESLDAGSVTAPHTNGVHEMLDRTLSGQSVTSQATAQTTGGGSRSPSRLTNRSSIQLPLAPSSSLPQPSPPPHTPGTASHSRHRQQWGHSSGSHAAGQQDHNGPTVAKAPSSNGGLVSPRDAPLDSMGPEVEVLIFIGTPRVHSLEEMQEAGLYLQDLPLSDMTAELLVLALQKAGDSASASAQLAAANAELAAQAALLTEQKELTEQAYLKLEEALEVALAARDEAHGVAETASQLQLSSEDSGVTFQSPAEKALALLDKMMHGVPVGMGEVLDVRDSILASGANLMVPANLDKQVAQLDQKGLWSDDEVHAALTALLMDERRRPGNMRASMTGDLPMGDETDGDDRDDDATSNNMALLHSISQAFRRSVTNPTDADDVGPKSASGLFQRAASRRSSMHLNRIQSVAGGKSRQNSYAFSDGDGLLGGDNNSALAAALRKAASSRSSLAAGGNNKAGSSSDLSALASTGPWLSAQGFAMDGGSAARDSNGNGRSEGVLQLIEPRGEGVTAESQGGRESSGWGRAESMDDSDVSRLVRDVMSKINDVADNIRVSSSGADLKRPQKSVCIATLPSIKPGAMPGTASAPQSPMIQGGQGGGSLQTRVSAEAGGAPLPSRSSLGDPNRLFTSLAGPPSAQGCSPAHTGEAATAPQVPGSAGAPVIRKEGTMVVPSSSKDGAGAKRSKGVRRRVSLMVLQTSQDFIAHLLKPPSDPLLAVLARVDDWTFNSFELADVTNGRPLSTLAYALISQRSGLASHFHISDVRLARYLTTIEDGYPENPYHNRTHAADVLRTMHILMTKGRIQKCMGNAGEVTLLSAYLAAVVHDYEHKGVNNDYLVKTGDVLALRYNDRSPMENHHAAAAFELLADETLDFFTNTPKKVKEVVRKYVIEAVLATDMKQHFSQNSLFNTKIPALLASTPGGAVRTNSGIPAEPATPGHSTGQAQASGGEGAEATCCPLLCINDEELRLLAVQMAIKCADLGHLAHDRPVHRRWVLALEEEMFRQGDRERAAGVPISALMDRTKAGITKSQPGFFSIVVLPQLRSFVQVFPACGPMLAQAKDNYNMWVDEASHEAAAAGAGGSAGGASPSAPSAQVSAAQQPRVQAPSSGH